MRRLCMKLGMWLIRRGIASLRQQELKSNGSPLVRDGSGPCRLQMDALDAAAVDVDDAIVVLQERAMALMQCQMQNM